MAKIPILDTKDSFVVFVPESYQNLTLARALTTTQTAYHHIAKNGSTFSLK